MEYPEEKVYRDMERDGYNKLVARNVELEEANAQLLEACEAAYRSDKFSLPTKTRVLLKNAIAAAKPEVEG